METPFSRSMAIHFSNWLIEGLSNISLLMWRTNSILIIHISLHENHERDSNDSLVPDDAPMPTFYSDMVAKYQTRILSASPFVKFAQPYLLMRAREQERRLVHLKKLRVSTVSCKISRKSSFQTSWLQFSATPYYKNFYCYGHKLKHICAHAIRSRLMRKT